MRFGSKESHFYQLARLANCALGRGGAVGVGRKLPAYSRVPSLTIRGDLLGAPRRCKNRPSPCVAWGAHMEAVGGGIFALRRPRPYSRHDGEIVAGYAVPTTICAHVGINGNGE